MASVPRRRLSPLEHFINGKVKMKQTFQKQGREKQRREDGNRKSVLQIDVSGWKLNGVGIKTEGGSERRKSEKKNTKMSEKRDGGQPEWGRDFIEVRALSLVMDGKLINVFGIAEQFC